MGCCVSHPSRRQFVQGASVAGLGLLAGCARLPGQAQAPARVARIGYLGGLAAVVTGDASNPGLEAFRQGLRELGYVEGQNLVLEWRGSGSRDFGDLDTLAAELVGLPVDIILAMTTPAALAAKRATSSIPIVFTSVSDPVESGLVASLGRPGANATGLSDFGAALSGKRLELLRDAVPGASRIGVVSLSRNPANVLGLRETQAAAPTLAVELILLEVRAEDTLDGAFEVAVQAGVDALIVPGGREVGAQAVPLAAKRRLPAMYSNAPNVYAGGLMAYAPSVTNQFQRAATYVDKILKGAKPAELPVEQPTTFEFVINLKTAQALGLTIPQHVLLQATEVIQ